MLVVVLIIIIIIIPLIKLDLKNMASYITQKTQSFPS